jgi:hypothetical protein
MMLTEFEEVVNGIFLGIQRHRQALLDVLAGTEPSGLHGRSNAGPYGHR